jgi:flagellar hook-length control protein FliK
MGMAQAVGAATAAAGAGAGGVEIGGAGGLAALFEALLGQGAGAGGVAGAGGLQGLLAALLQGFGQQQGAGQQQGGLAALLAQLNQTAQASGQGTDPQGKDGLMALLAQLSQLAGQLQNAGVDLSKISNAQDLSAALQKLGMKPADADKAAGDVMKLLDAAKKKLDLPDDTTPGALLAMLAPPAPQAVTQDATKNPPEVDAIPPAKPQGHAAAKAFGKQKAPTAADLARQVTGIAEEAGEDAAAPDGAAHARPDAKPEVVAGDAVPASDPPKADAKDARTDQGLDAAAVVAAPVVAGQAVTAPAKAKPSDNKAVDIAAAKPDPLAPNPSLDPAVAPVQPDKVIDKPQGTEVLKFTTDADGKDVVERKVDASTLREAGNSHPNAEALGLGTNRTDRTAAPGTASFAERLAQATRADATQQTLVQVKGLAAGGGGTVRMVLNPPELGTVHIQITVTGDGKVDGQISATSNAVVELLARDVHSLKHGLESSGLKLGDQGLSLMLNNGNQQNPQGQQQGQQGQAAAGAPNWSARQPDGTDAVETPDPAAWVAPERILDVRV